MYHVVVAAVSSKGPTELNVANTNDKLSVIVVKHGPNRVYNIEFRGTLGQLRGVRAKYILFD